MATDNVDLHLRPNGKTVRDDGYGENLALGHVSATAAQKGLEETDAFFLRARTQKEYEKMLSKHIKIISIFQLFFYEAIRSPSSLLGLFFVFFKNST